MAPSESRIDTGGIEVECAFCGHEDVPVDRDRGATCPNCERSVSVHVAEEFTLVERDGWAVRVAVDAADETGRESAVEHRA